METAMSLDAEEMIQLLLKTNKEQEQTITDLRATIKDLRSTIANLNETLDELKRKLFGSSSEKTKASADCIAPSNDDDGIAAVIDCLLENTVKL